MTTKDAPRTLSPEKHRCGGQLPPDHGEAGGLGDAPALRPNISLCFSPFYTQFVLSIIHPMANMKWPLRAKGLGDDVPEGEARLLPSEMPPQTSPCPPIPSALSVLARPGTRSQLPEPRCSLQWDPSWPYGDLR